MVKTLVQLTSKVIVSCFAEAVNTIHLKQHGLNVWEGTVTTCVTATVHYDVFAQSQGCSLPNRTWHYNCTQVQLEMCLDSNLCTVMRGNDLGSLITVRTNFP
jgi:hypothetical protein